MQNKVDEISLEQRFVSAFEMNVGRTLNGTNDTLSELRKSAIERFRKLGFPTPKSEAWKYTNINKVLQRDFGVQLTKGETTLTKEHVETYLVPDLDANVAVLVNGRFVRRLSDLDDVPEGVLVTSLEEAARKHADILNQYFGRTANSSEVFTTLNTAFALDGLFVFVPKRRVLDRPIHVLNLIDTDDDLFIQPRNLFVFEEASQARVIDTGVSLGTGHTFTNSVTEISVGPRAVIEMYSVQDNGPNASGVTNLDAHQADESVFTVHTVTLSGAVVRNNLSIVPDGEFCESHLYGLFLPVGETHVDNHTLVDHVQPNCMSNELYKGVLDENGSGVFNGKVLVRPDAQKTNAFQENKAILLSDTSTMNAKPELEIYADDVKCSHGATTGQLDPEALFYLRSRGIPEREARGMLLHAFARDVIDVVKIEPLRILLDRRVSQRFGW